MAEASVGQATAGKTSCASSCEENKCTSVNEVLYQTSLSNVIHRYYMANTLTFTSLILRMTLGI